MEFAYVGWCFLLCYLPILTSGQDAAIQFELKVYPTGERVEVDLGTAKALTCKVSVTSGDAGDQQPTLQWFFEGTEVTDTNKASRVHIENHNMMTKLIIKTATDDDGGQYRCEGSLAGQQDSRSVLVEIYQKMEVHSKAEQSGIFGKDGVLDCEVTGKPTPVITWQFSNSSNIPNNDKYVKQGNQLIIKNLNMEDSATYICYIEVESKGDILPFDIQYTVAKPPTITAVLTRNPVHPTEGQKVTITCQADGFPQPTIIYKKEGNIVDASMVSGGVLTIESLSQADEANYFCIATNMGGSANKSTFLDVNIKPKVTITEMTPSADNGDPVSGQTVSYKCEAEGDPKPDVKWKKASSESYYESGTIPNEMTIESGGGTDPSDAVVKRVSQTMTFNSITHQDAGKYECLAANVVGTVSEEVTISIRYPPDFNTGFDENVFYGWKGHIANLTCQATANPTPLYRWYKAKEGTTNEIAEEEIKTGGIYRVAKQQTWEEYKLSSSSLMIDMTVSDNVYGFYACQADNGLQELRPVHFVELKEATPPGQPEVSLHEAFTSMVTLNLVAPSVTGFQPVTGYSYEYNPASEPGNKITGSADLTGPVTKVDIMNLETATKYSIMVRAVNLVGQGQPMTITFDTKERSTPLRLSLRSNKEGEDANTYTLTWDEPDNGEDPIQQFIVKYTKVSVTVDENDDWEVENILGEEVVDIFQGSNHEQHTLKNLEKDSYYQVKVSAVNGVGESDPAVMLFKTSKGAGGSIKDSGTAILGNLATLTLSLLLACLATAL